MKSQASPLTTLLRAGRLLATGAMARISERARLDSSDNHVNGGSIWSDIRAYLKGLIVFLLVLLVQSLPAVARPSVEWSPSSITGSISPGESTTITASFAVQKDISRQVRVRVVPSLAPFVSVTPSSFDGLVAGETKSVSITFSASESAPTGMFEGTIQLRGRGTIAKPLPVNLMIEEGPPSIIVTVLGSVSFDTGEPVAGAQVSGSIAPSETSATLQAALTADALQPDTTNPEFKANPVIVEGQPLLFLGADAQDVVTGPSGDFMLELTVTELPAEVLVEVLFQSAALPEVRTARIETAETALLDLGTITIPNAAQSELLIVDGSGATADGSIRMDGLPPEVQQLFSRSFDPDQDPEAFPGEFAEMGNIPLNSAVFLWIEAIDAEGNPVTDLSQAVTIRTLMPTSQWGDLEDINFGTDRIEIPIYIYNELSNMWEQQGVGWLEDGLGTVLPEDAQSVILDGTFPGDIFATFVTNHFSWMNVDYAFIGPWTLSRLDPNRRNDSCLFDALQLTKTIAKSAVGRSAYAKVNKEGADFDIELADANGPELVGSDNPHEDAELEFADYAGDRGGSETQFAMNNAIWDRCAAGATQKQVKNTNLIMAVTILHETAHWKDDVKKFPDDDSDTDGEEGNQLERDIFGGLVAYADGTVNGSQITRDGIAVSDEQRDQWLDLANWPPPTEIQGLIPVSRMAQAADEMSLGLSIFLPKTDFELGEEISIEVIYENISSSPIRVLNRVILEGWPLYFKIVDQQTGGRILFLDSERKLALQDADFLELNPGEAFAQTVNLLRDPLTGRPRYQLLTSGEYEITAVYEPFRGVPETISNTLAFAVGTGGSISGVVMSASTVEPISGADIRVLQEGNLLTRAQAENDGSYLIPELPPGTYTLEASAPGFLRSSQEDIEVQIGQNTVVNFSLSSLLSAGEIRLVLTWGATPTDLDSHLWLPAETPFHVAFFRHGSFEVCPFAELDVDDVSSFGPETITISQRFDGTYQYAIFNFSGFPDLTQSQAQVQVFDSSGLLATFDVPTEGSGRWWNVLTIDGATGAITEINQLGGNPEPYPDTTAGCAS